MLENEIAKHQREIDELNSQGEDLKSKGAQAVIEPTLHRLNQRWQQVQCQVSSVAQDTPSPDSDSSPMSATASTNATSFIVTSHVTRVVFSNVPVKFVEELEKLLQLITDIQEELQSPILHGQQYEDFSRQEDKLKVQCLI